MVSFITETPDGQEILPPDKWFEQQMVIIKTPRSNIQKTTDVLPYLTFIAGERAVAAIRDYNVYELAIAFTSHYGWQLINGAKILPHFGELAKVYAGVYAVYLFRRIEEKKKALELLENKV